MQDDIEFDEAELMDDSPWDWENAEVREGKPAPRTTFSLRLSPDELDEIIAAAQASGMKTGEFIRTAALAAARGEADGDATAALVGLARRCGMKVTFEPIGRDEP